MGLLNYTTQIEVSKTIGEIMGLLVDAGAQVILSEYDDAKNICAISFKLQTRFGVVPYRIPCELKGVLQILTNQVRTKKIPKKFLNDVAQARRVGWRIIKDWLAAQLAIVETKMVEIEQVMLPYMQTNNGETFYNRLVNGNRNALMLEDLTNPVGD